MASTTSLWLAFEEAFAEIERLCVEARAAQLALHRREEEAVLVRGLGAARVSAPAPARAPSLRPPGQDNLREARASDLARDLSFYEAHAAGPNLVLLRASIRERLQWLKGELATVLTEHELHYVLLPLVIYIDELVTSITRGEASRWEPLQSELYDVENGGELFYGLMEDHLRKSDTHPFVFQIFYFCLSDGFVGMAERDPRKIEQSKAALTARIPLVPPAKGPLQERDQPIELVKFPLHYYAWAAVAMLFSWAAFSFAAKLLL
ncbi:MAG TPA: DotU family type IV/VI secretion system protein [Polyangiales bacterium]